MTFLPRRSMVSLASMALGVYVGVLVVNAPYSDEAFGSFDVVITITTLGLVGILLLAIVTLAGVAWLIQRWNPDYASRRDRAPVETLGTVGILVVIGALLGGPLSPSALGIAMFVIAATTVLLWKFAVRLPSQQAPWVSFLVCAVVPSVAAFVAPGVIVNG